MCSFTCQRCGHCCEGGGGIIISSADFTRLHTHLNLTPTECSDLYIETVNGKQRLRSNSNNFCIFFKIDVGCGIHTVRPDICRAWPYFRGNLVDAESLTMAKEYCPGISKELSFTDFQKQGIDYLQAHNLIRKMDKAEAQALCNADIVK